LGDPAWQGQLSANLELSKFNLGYRMRYNGKQTIGLYETQHSLQGRPPTNPDAFPKIWYPAQTFHDLRLDWTPTKKYRFYVGVDNVLDQLPLYDLLGVESGSPSPVGRFYYAGLTLNLNPPGPRAPVAAAPALPPPPAPATQTCPDGSVILATAVCAAPPPPPPAPAPERGL